MFKHKRKKKIFLLTKSSALVNCRFIYISTLVGYMTATVRIMLNPQIFTVSTAALKTKG